MNCLLAGSTTLFLGLANFSPCSSVMAERSLKCGPISPLTSSGIFESLLVVLFIITQTLQTKCQMGSTINRRKRCYKQHESKCKHMESKPCSFQDCSARIVVTDMPISTHSIFSSRSHPCVNLDHIFPKI